MLQKALLLMDICCHPCYNYNSFSILLFVYELFNNCIVICVIVFTFFAMWVIKYTSNLIEKLVQCDF